MAVGTHQKITGLSGNEIFCLNKVGLKPGQLCVGNSVVALGVGGSLGAGLSTLGGGEVNEITQLVHRGRSQSLARMMTEAKKYGGIGITGVSFDLITHGTNLEFLTIGSTIHMPENDALRFSTSANGQELYCQLDAGFEPRGFVFGNVAYSIGIGGNITGALRSIKRGEVSEYSQIFDRTRHLALERIVAEAKALRANAVIGIETTISPLMGAQEMILVGTASHHPALAQFENDPVTSDMTNEEMWNLVNLGYMPLRLVMGVSVYSLGLAGGLAAAFKSLSGGEVTGLTELLYEARQKALARIEADAERCGADEVVGVKTHVYDLGRGMVEFMAIGTAVKKMPGVTTKHPDLPPQAIIRDRDTLVDSTAGAVNNLGRREAAAAPRMQRGPLSILFVVVIVIFYIVKIFLSK